MLTTVNLLGESVKLGRLDVKIPSTRANSFITDICIWFLRDRNDPWLPTATWVRLLGDVEIPDATARTALHRMTQAGFLDRRAVAGRPGYAMSNAWVEFQRTAAAAPRDVRSDGWVLLTFTIPETQRAD